MIKKVGSNGVLVKFGRGSVLISGAVNELNGLPYVRLQHSDSVRPVGIMTFSPQEDSESDKIVLSFKNEESIDVLLDYLYMAKEHLANKKD